MRKLNIVQNIITNKTPKRDHGVAFAPVNIALCKYWGKRDIELNLPITSSLSISLGEKGAHTNIELTDKPQDEIFINNTRAKSANIITFLDLFRFESNVHYKVTSVTNVPVAAGLASSACGYAALVQALNNLYDWRLDKTSLSILARLGSGSACRSLWSGFVKWDKGTCEDGMDSYGWPLADIWPELRVGICLIDTAVKPISSRQAMQQTVVTSKLYASWPDQVANDMIKLTKAIDVKNFTLFGETAETNAIAMHATMKAAKPSINYSQPATIKAVEKIQQLRKDGLQLYFTQDAGPNLKLLFLAKDTERVRKAFPDAEILAPFADPNIDQVILVDKNDKSIGVTEKMAAHKQAQLHRAFSVFIFRKKNNNIELLLQQRQQDKYHCGGLWSNTCCSHPRPGEDVIIAAGRRLQEEMGFTTELNFASKFQYKTTFANGLTENELDHVLIGTTTQNQFNINPKEVQNYKWTELTQLQTDLHQNSNKYTPWFKQALTIAVKNIILQSVRIKSFDSLMFACY